MKVSVIIPAFNRESYLPETLDSVWRQVHRPVEVVVVDDGSTDGSVAVAKQFARDRSGDSFEVFVIEQPNAGPTVARNHGFEASTGDAVLFLDSDDVLDACGLAASVHLLCEGDLDFVHARVQSCDADLKPWNEEPIGSEFGGSSEELIRYHWHTMGGLYRRDTVVRAGGWFTDIIGSDDWVFQVRVKLVSNRWAYGEHLHGFYRQHADERLIVSRFKRSFVLDVERACIEIARLAEAHGRFTPGLRWLLAKRLAIHALELGANGCAVDRKRLIKRALAWVDGQGGRRAALTAVCVSPVFLDRLLYAFLR